MANTNFTVHNGLTVGPAFVYAGNGDIITSGNISVTGSASFGGLSSNQIYSGSNNVTVSGSTVNVAIASSNIASFSSTGLTLTGAVQANTHTGVAVYGGTIGNTGTTLTGTLSTNAQPYVTSVGTLGSLTVTGAVNGNTFNGVAVYGGTIGNTGTTLTGTLSTAAQTNITSVGTLSSLAASGVITSGGNINVTSATNSTSTTSGSIVTAGGVGVSQDLYIGGKLYVGGNTTFINTTIINTTDTLSAPTIQAGTIGNSGAVLYGTLNSASASQTNITSVGTLSGLTVSSAIVPSSNASINIGGTGSQYFNNIYAVNFLGTSTTAKYADLAERYSSDANYEPGTVVDFGGEYEVTLSNIDSSPSVAGVVSTNPAYMMNSDADGLYIALTGRVPTKVTGPVRKGQMMVSNGDGTARGENNPIMGSVIGKSLENFAGDVGVIEVVVGRL